MVQTDEERALVELEEERCAAQADRNWSFLEKVHADEFTYTHTQGHTESKAEYLASLKARDRAVKRLETEVTLYGDTAVVRGRAHFTMMAERVAGHEGDPPVPLRESTHLLLEVWVRRAGQWQIVAIQGTRTTE